MAEQTARSSGTDSQTVKTAVQAVVDELAENDSDHSEYIPVVYFGTTEPEEFEGEIPETAPNASVERVMTIEFNDQNQDSITVYRGEVSNWTTPDKSINLFGETPISSDDDEYVHYNLKGSVVGYRQVQETEDLVGYS